MRRARVTGRGSFVGSLSGFESWASRVASTALGRIEWRVLASAGSARAPSMIRPRDRVSAKHLQEARQARSVVPLRDQQVGHESTHGRHLSIRAVAHIAPAPQDRSNPVRLGGAGNASAAVSYRRARDRTDRRMTARYGLVALDVAMTTQGGRDSRGICIGPSRRAQRGECGQARSRIQGCDREVRRTGGSREDSCISTAKAQYGKS